MKKKLYILMAMLIVALSVTARTFSSGERLYFRAAPNDATWWTDYSANLVAYVFKGSNYQWVTSTDYDGTYRYLEMPAGDWEKLILVRIQPGKPVAWENKWSQTGDIVIPAQGNCIDNFRENSVNATWISLPPQYCAITSFVGISADPNVTDKLCNISGVVAFDDKVNAGDLMIWSDNVDTIIIANADVKMPQQFLLENFDASTPKNYTLHAKFINGTSDCEASCVVNVKMPAADITEHTTTGSTDSRLVRFTQEDVTLTPNDQITANYQWYTVENGEETPVATLTRNATFTAPAVGQDITYLFKAFKDPAPARGNLIENGSFELDEPRESNYKFWGKNQTNFYTGENADTTGGYAQVKNARTFWHAYSPVTAHDGDYFGLFDSEKNASTDQGAWIATTSQNPKLTVKQGATYLFSFWVANINNLDEMYNGAQLQFQISYDGGANYSALGGMASINLSDYLDSRWHGCSALEVATKTSDNVVLRVINLNKTSNNIIGNDFALDDIRFEEVVASSSNIAAYEIFKVKYLLCQITNASFTQRQPIGCGTATAPVDYKIDFVNPRGDLYIYEGATQLAHIPAASIAPDATSYSGVLADRPVDGNTHTLTVYFDDGNVKTDAPQDYTYLAKQVPSISLKSEKWAEVECDVLTTSLEIEVGYINQNGTLTAKVDGGEAVTATYSVEEPTEQPVKLTIPNIPTDGLPHNLEVKFDGSHGCTLTTATTAAPRNSKINSVAASTVLGSQICNSKDYKVDVTVDFVSPYGDLIITDNASKTKTFTEAELAGLTSATATFDYTTAAGTRQFTAYFSTSEDCKTLPAHNFTFTEPTRPVVDSITANPQKPDCDVTTFSVSGNVELQFASNSIVTITDKESGKSATVQANGDYQIDGIPADSAIHTLEVYCSEDEASCVHTETYRAPFMPSIDEPKATPSKPESGETKYDLTVDVTFKNGQGRIIVIECKDLGLIWKEKAPATNSLSYTFKGIETDNGVEHEVIIYFENVDCQKTCKFKSPIAFDFKNFAVAITPLNCNTEYKLTFTGEMFGLSGNLVITDQNTGVELYNKPAPAVSPFSVDVTLSSTDVAPMKKTYEAYFSSNKTLTQTAKGTSIAKPVLTLARKEQTVTCDGKVTEQLTITFANQAGNLVITDNGVVTQTIAAPVSPEAYNLVLDADGAAHTLKAYFDGAGLGEDCGESLAFTTAKALNVKTFAAVPSAPQCDKTTYDLALTLDAENTVGTLHFELDGVDQAYTGTMPNYTISGLAADGASHNLRAYWDGGNTCGTTPVSFDAPAVPHIKTFGSVSVGAADCTTGLYDIAFQLDYENMLGNLEVRVDGALQTISGAMPNYTITGLTADGASHNLSVSWDAAGMCADQVSFDAPVWNQLTAFTAVPQAVRCTDTQYKLDINVKGTAMFNTANPKQDIVVLDGTTQIATIVLSNTASGAFDKSVQLTLDNDQATHTLTAYFANRTDCSLGANYAAPTIPECLIVNDTLCAGDSYMNYGLALSGLAAGDAQYQSEDTTVNLHVLDQPTISVAAPAGLICNSDANIALAHTTTGEADLYSITFTGTTFPAVVEQTLTAADIIIPMPANAKPGVYTATITVRNHAVTCEATASVTFEISQSDLVYAKWNDVLLVANRDGKFTNYQWYHNGEKMDGETQQRLYNPADMTGMFYCEVTTDEGETFKTCEAQFDQAPYSRDQNSVAPTKVQASMPMMLHRADNGEATVRIMSVTGQHISTEQTQMQDMQLTAPQIKGVYLIVGNDANGQWTQKIVVE